MPIYKTQLVVTILSDQPTEAAMREFLHDQPLSSLGESIEEGENIGVISISSIEELPDERVADELRAVGNDDASFFDLNSFLHAD